MKLTFFENFYSSLILFTILILFISSQAHAQAIGTMGISGNVGIGSISPGELLDVQGTARASDFSGTGSINGPYVKVTNSQASGTGGGSATTNAWSTMPLNTKDIDTANIATLSSNTITLPAGTYLVRTSSPFYETNDYQTRLYNSTASTVLINGSCGYSQDGGYATPSSIINGEFTISAQSNIILQYYVTDSPGSGTLGFSVGAGTEVYAQVEFWKIS